MTARVTMTALGVALAVTSCGADPAPPEPSPQGAAQTSASESPSVSPNEAASPSVKPSPTEKPLSRFEDEPQVKALRGVMRAIGKAVNRNDAELTVARMFLTPQAVTEMPAVIEEDLGLYYPGPMPMTPTRVEQTGPRRALVTTCLWSDGWALTRRGGLPARKKEIVVVSFAMTKERGAWRVDAFELLDAPCEAPVKGVAW